jgi:hypothetical protein
VNETLPVKQSPKGTPKGAASSDHAQTLFEEGVVSEAARPATSTWSRRLIRGT